jgi:hypothetical protein
MPPKTIHPRVNDDPRRYSDDPALADIRKIQSEIRARKPLAIRSPYVDVDDDSDDDLARYRGGEKEEPQVPQRPPITAIIQALESFADKPLAKMGPRTKGNTEAYKQALSDFRNLVNCPMPNCSGGGVTQTALLDHLREKHREIMEYHTWLNDKVKTPYLYWLKQSKDAEEDFHRCEKEIRRFQPLLKELQSRKEKIEDRHSMADAYVYGRNSPEYQLAEEKARDELEPVLKRIADVKREITGYEMRQHQAERRYNIAGGHIYDMEKDKDIGPLLVPINLAGGKQTWLFTEEQKMLEPITSAIYRGAAFERAAWTSPIPSKGTLVLQRSPREEAEHVRHLQSYVREHDPDYM